MSDRTRVLLTVLAALLLLALLAWQATTWFTCIGDGGYYVTGPGQWPACLPR